MSDVDGTVIGIQGRDVDSAAPNDGDVYRWDATNSKWAPVAPPQPLEPWVGSVNTQQQVIQRIPWTCRTTGSSAVSTGVSISVPTDKALVLFVYSGFRHPSSVAGANAQATMLVIANNGGTLTSPNYDNISGAVSGSLAATGNPTFQIAVSGTTATLEIAFFTAGGGTVVDCQGYVDLMIV